MQVNMHEAKTQLSKLVEAALRGEEVVIANRGKAVVKLVKVEAPVRRVAGAWKGLMTEAEIDAAFAPDFDAALAAEWNAWMDEPIEPKPRQRSRAPQTPTKQVASSKRAGSKTSSAASRKTRR